VDVICAHSSGLVTSIHLNYVQSPERHVYEIVGDFGWASADFTAGEVVLASGREENVYRETAVQPRHDIFRAEHRAFFETLDGLRPPETSAADGLVSTAVCEAAVESRESGQRVSRGIRSILD
jgi:predicted dehydrogenase